MLVKKIKLKLKLINKIKKIFLYSFIGFSTAFIAMLFFMTVPDVFTGGPSQIAEYCEKYSFLASAGCWK
jgi:hypothetical protein